MSARQLWAVLALIVLCFVTVTAQSADQDTAEQWLERMIGATRTLSYEGVFVYIQGQDIEIMAITHRYREGREQQRMYSLTGPRREILVDNGHVICVFPDQHFAFELSRFDRSPFPISFPRELSKLHHGYNFELLPEERMLDRTTLKVAVRPRDDMRYGYYLWLDKETGLVLRSALVDHSGRFVEQLLFTHIVIGADIAPERLAPSQQSQAVLDTVTLQQKQPKPNDGVQPRWQASELPTGFTQVMHQRHGDGEQTPTTEQLVFRDGLATVSVFIEEFTSQPLLIGASRMDAVNTYGVVINDRYQVIAVGEVPLKTVASIAASVTPVTDP